MRGEQLLQSARLFERQLLNFFLRKGVPRSDGDDLVQETLLRLWKYRNRYETTAKLSTFLFLIARQVFVDAARKISRRRRREEEYAVDAEAVQLPAETAAEDVRWALSRLSPSMREVVELAVMEDLPYAEIAQRLSIPVGTVKSRMFNALKKLKEIADER